MRKPNTMCIVCGAGVYRRPTQLAKQINIFCSVDCMKEKCEVKDKPCEYCSNPFKPTHSTTRFCSKNCSVAFVRRENPWSTEKKPGQTQRHRSQYNLWLLKQTFNFESCMVQGCDYDKTYDLHRLVEGKNGGEYKIGNMFAICPNHHAEVHRGIVKLTKVSDCELKTEYGSVA